jgi:thiamine biosynthesis lipoprotein
MRALFLFTISTLLLIGCRQQIRNTIKISGQAQGTTYNITYLAGPNSNFRQQFDSIFRQIDASLSTYDSASLISRINRNDSTALADAMFSAVFEKALEVSDKTNGMFDITVAPVVNAYGFGFAKREKVTKPLIDSLLPYVGYKKVRLENMRLVKEMPQVMLDFNAIAQGYTVDVLAAFLESKDISNYLVEVGGELRAKGKRLDDSPWTVGIEQPNEDDTEGAAMQVTLQVKDISMATSGNYKRFYTEDGQKYAHIINPFTGYPAKNNLLSATVVADDCMTADAYATAFMVMGLEQAKQFVAANPNLNLEVLFIYDENGTWKTYTSAKFNEHVNMVQ